tara:strand:- start:468 stop:749 length:282 start_codon:yes stop_codon:yes gene_type:complete
LEVVVVEQKQDLVIRLVMEMMADQVVVKLEVARLVLRTLSDKELKLLLLVAQDMEMMVALARPVPPVISVVVVAVLAVLVISPLVEAQVVLAV